MYDILVTLHRDTLLQTRRPRKPSLGIVRERQESGGAETRVIKEEADGVRDDDDEEEVLVSE